MKQLLALILFASFCVTAAAQTIRTLGYNTTNGQVVAATSVTFTNAIGFTTNAAAATRTNLVLGAADSVVFSNLTLSSGAQTNLAVAMGSTNRGFYGGAAPPQIRAVVDGVDSLIIFTNALEVPAGLNVVGISTFGGNISFVGSSAASNAAITRTNLGLGLPALTNTSNVTLMRALAGSTNANPVNANIIFEDVGGQIHEIFISNGIIMNWGLN